MRERTKANCKHEDAVIYSNLFRWKKPATTGLFRLCFATTVSDREIGLNIKACQKKKRTIWGQSLTETRYFMINKTVGKHRGKLISWLWYDKHQNV